MKYHRSRVKPSRRDPLAWVPKWCFQLAIVLIVLSYLRVLNHEILQQPGFSLFSVTWILLAGGLHAAALEVCLMEWQKRSRTARAVHRLEALTDRLRFIMLFLFGLGGLVLATHLALVLGGALIGAWEFLLIVELKRPTP